jgi:aldose 1-epimerase
VECECSEGHEKDRAAGDATSGAVYNDGMSAAPYSAERTTDHGVAVVRLTDEASGVEIFVAPTLGNRAYAMKVRGANILHMPARNIAELTALSGIPFLAPWANRIPGGGFRANGQWYAFNESLGTLRIHPGHIAIHGMLTSSDLWQVTDTDSDSSGAWVSSRLEFWRYPRLMANWPFAHEYEMTYRLSGGELETDVAVKNLSAEPMPIVIGFHPYVTIPGVPRVECLAHIPARTSVVVDEHMCATGEMRPNPLPDPTPLATHLLDDGYTDLTRDARGNSVFWLEGGGRRIEVSFGPKWQVGVVYAPAGQEFICFEPMAAVTNGVKLAAEGKYDALQTLEPGGIWRESFRVRGINFSNLTHC